MIADGADAAGLSLDDLLGNFAPEPEPECAAASATLGPYRCLRRTLVRDGYEAFSSVIGALEAGEVVDVVEEQVLENGASRLRVERAAGSSGPVGWVSATGPTGQAFLVPAGDEPAEETSQSDTASAPAATSAGSTSSSEQAAPSAVEPKKSWFRWAGSSATNAEGESAVVPDPDARSDRPLVPIERVRMVSVVTRTDDKGKQYTAFGITVYPLPVATGQGGSEFLTAKEWIVYRRFSEFVELRTQLLAIDKTFEQLEFPPKRVSMFAGSAQINTGRRLALERWLTAVLAQPISNELVSRFAAPDLELATPDETVGADGRESAAESAATPAADSPPAPEIANAATNRTWRLRKIKITVPTDDGEQAHGGGKEDTVYTLQIHPREKDAAPWEVLRKYSEFCTLRAALRKSCGAVLRSNDRVFPVNRVWTRKQLDTKAADDRLTSLQMWMDNVVGLRPDAAALMDFVTPEAAGGGENGASLNDNSPVVEVGEAAVAWGASLGSLLSSPALAIMRGAAGGLSNKATEDAVGDSETRPAGRELPLPLDAAWTHSKPMLTPSTLRSGDETVEYPKPARMTNEYTAEESGLLPAPCMDLYRVTHEHRPGVGFQPLVVKRASITGISTKFSQGKEITVYTLYCEPREGFGWVVSKRFSDFVTLRTALGAIDEAVLGLQFPAKWFPGMMLGSEETQRAAAMTRKKVLAAWLTEAIALCMEHQPLLLFFHGSSDTDTADVHDERKDVLRDSASDALKDLVLVSHVTIRVAPAPTGGFWKGERQFVVWVFPEFGGEGWRILRTMTDFVGIRTKLIAELEPVENIEFPAVSGWSAFGSKETDAVLAGRASLLQAWVEGTLSLARRNPLLLEFLQDDDSFAEESDTKAPAASGADVPPEKEVAAERVIAKYQCLRRCQIRAEAAMDSEKVGVLDMGATVAVFEETKLENGTHRVRFDKGWCSLATADGTTVLAKRSEPRSVDEAELDASTHATSTSPDIGNDGAMSTESGEEQPATNIGWLGSLLPSSPWRSSTATSGSEAAQRQEREAQELLLAAGPGQGEWV